MTSIKVKPAIKVGILTFFSTVILIYGLMWLKGRSISTAERIEVKFQDVDGMRPGSAVQMMGIRVGQIEEVVPVIKKDGSYVSVKFVLTEPGIKIPRASTISIQQSGIIGEQFLEITPPQTQDIYLPAGTSLKEFLKKGSSVEILANGKYMNIGEIRTIELIDTKTLSQDKQDAIAAHYAYKVRYIITTPGIIIPDNAKGNIVKNSKNKYEYELKILAPDNMLVQAPNPENQYTIVEPMRLKKFFDLQLASAASLKMTNDKINSILSKESISDLKATLKNTKNLTAEATETLKQANQLIASSKDDVNSLINLASQLSEKMVTLTDNVNSVISDPELKKNFLQTVNSIQKSSKSIAEILNDPKMKETLYLINGTTKDLSEITSYMNNITKSEDVRTKMDTTITNLNTSLEKLSKVLDNVNNLTTDEQVKLKSIIQDSSEISGNLKVFSKKLNKKFLLMRLLF